MTRASTRVGETTCLLVLQKYRKKRKGFLYACVCEGVDEDIRPVYPGFLSE